MFSIVVLLCFFALFGAIIFGRREYQYIWILCSIVFFPPCIYLYQSPQISPQQALLYFFFAYNVLRYYNALKSSIIKLPVLLILILIFISLLLSVYVNGDGIKGAYNAVRYFMENYSYFIIAFGAGLFYKKIMLEEKVSYLAMILLFFGLMEFALGDNFIFRKICSAFPYYDGYYDLSGTITASRSYRSRIFISTIHPTALGAMLSCTFLFFVCVYKNLSWRKDKKLFIGLILFFLIVLSGSRTALACSLFGLFLFLFQQIKVSSKILVLAFIGLGLSVFSQTILDKFSVEGQGSSISLRQEQLLFSWVQFSKSPILGNGIKYTSKNIMERDTYNDRVTNTEIGGLESVVFYQLIDYGLVGLFLYCLLYLICFIYFFRRRSFHFAQAGLIITICFFIFACLSGEMGGNNTFAYMLIGYCMGATYVHEKNELENSDKDLLEEKEV
jgi:hypothetical protein